MRAISRLALMVIFSATVCSCSGKKAADLAGRGDEAQAAAEGYRSETVKTAEVFKKEAITLMIKADPQLNRYQRNPHTLYLCIYQLKDPNGFNQLAEERGGVPKLLECSRFDGSVANAKQFVIQPGQELKDIRDRAEGARYIGVATGYYGTGKEKLTGLSPLSPRSSGAGSVIRIELGPHEITGLKVN